jgi:putative transposase
MCACDKVICYATGSLCTADIRRLVVSVPRSAPTENLALRHQLAVYHQTIHRPRLRPSDRLSWAWLSRLWPGWQAALAFVQPRTVIAWQQRRLRGHWQHLSHRSQPGRPTIAKEVRDLIRTMWQANPTWGAPRIVGELRKLGLEVAKSTVEMYHVRPQRPSSPTWKTFLTNHVQDLVALDCLVVPMKLTAIISLPLCSLRITGEDHTLNGLT